MDNSPTSAEVGATLRDPAPDIVPVDVANLAIDKTLETLKDAHHMVTFSNGDTYETTHCRIHSTRWCTHVNHTDTQFRLKSK